ncbi:E3 ubiquitin-protein ligase rnf8-like [Oppia nitens]|uniref:E3 ubiquitin-protein ligase rnf8-like n=1 Tax=Oppia nitens TaxID=1686743 RepID=UPI0023DC2BA6|nr:E3 ubiquitin-protein ligase rnf8-like [Oppia nitens]
MVYNNTRHALIPVMGHKIALKTIELVNDQRVVIGREKSCDQRIDSIEVSRRHAYVTHEDNNWFITDLESTNGLFINSIKLIAFTPYCLQSGDKISFGPLDQSEIIFKYVDNYCNDKNVIKNNNSSHAVKRKMSGDCDHQLSHLVTKRVCTEWSDLLDSELCCAICSELFVFAVSLNCGHTFCLSCIEQWKHSRDGLKPRHDDGNEESTTSHETHCCPVCRQEITSQNRVLVLDNTIDHIIEKLSPKLFEYRKQLIAERKQLYFS